MPKHIGIIACSYEGAALCYQTVSNEGANYLGKHAHPEISLHNHPLNENMKYIEVRDWEGVSKIILSSAGKLYKVGTNFLISPDNTIHQSFFFVEKDSPLPWLHISEEVTKVTLQNNYKKIGILGTNYLMKGPVYPEKFEEKI